MMVGVTSYEDALAKLQQGAGGIFITSWADPAILTEPGRDIAALRETVGRDFSVSIDFEGGRVQRHSEILGNWPAPREMAATRTPEEVRALAAEMGKSLADHGITVNFAPVVDLDIAELDVIGDRSFSPDPVVAADYAAAFATGMKDAGVTAVFKHFPGHGQASGDTHTGFAVTPPIEVIREQDLPPFGRALTGAPGEVMVGHMVVPGLGDESLPSSLDPAVYQLLRSGAYPEGVPFNGVAYTDDLSGMAAITDLMSTPEAVAAAIGAGADQALWSSDESLEVVIDTVMAAIEAGTISEEQIQESAERVQV
nr:glycoside hydrolase family 3 N-terminal domain-containing protein [Corynebacterium occultum]